MLTKLVESRFSYRTTPYPADNTQVVSGPMILRSLAVKRQKKNYIPAILLGSCLASSPTCLPDNYFALSVRNIAVSFADTVLGTLVAPVLDTIDPPVDTDGTATDTTG